jgi:DNA-binding transcriptional MerR regulator
MIATARPKADPAMPTDPPEATRRETWLDWIPDEVREEALLEAEPLLTRDELITELKNKGAEVTPRELTRWQSLGVIPYPQKRRYRGKVRGVYPQWAIPTIHLLKSLQDHDYTLRDIGPLLRGDVYHRFLPKPEKTPRQQRDHDRRLARRELFPLADEIESRLRTLARIHERIRGGQIVRVDVRLVNADESGFTYPFLVSNEESTPQDDR